MGLAYATSGGSGDAATQVPQMQAWAGLEPTLPLAVDGASMTRRTGLNTQETHAVSGKTSQGTEGFLTP